MGRGAGRRVDRVTGSGPSASPNMQKGTRPVRSEVLFMATVDPESEPA